MPATNHFPRSSSGNLENTGEFKITGTKGKILVFLVTEGKKNFPKNAGIYNG